MTSFPFVGEFPYLGFYSKDDALEYKEELESKNYYTYIRPVLAYSTLNRLFFKDNILSTFFRYNDFDLADLIFHELVHTIFFIDGNVSFNESLADYIASEMTNEYFQVSKEENEKKLDIKNRYLVLAKEITELVKAYKSQLVKNKPKNKDDADKTLKIFLFEAFIPKVKNKCKLLNLSKCWPLKESWNNARFTAFLTYNSKKNIISSIREKNKFTLNQLLKFLEMKHEEFKDSKFQSFTDFLAQ
jgi:predicted aminopeptidase